MRWLQTAAKITIGQLVSLFSVLTLVIAKALVVRGVSVPGLLNLFFYVVLGMLCISYSWARECKEERKQRPGTPLTTNSPQEMEALAVTPVEAKAVFDDPKPAPTSVSWWMYPLAAMLDVEANFCAVRALAYVNYITLGLMLNLAIPFLSLLHYGINRKEHTRVHIAGCCIALASAIPLFCGAYQMDRFNDDATHSSMSYQLYGTLLAFMAAFLYAASNIASQWCVKEQTLDGTIESTGFVAVWATVFSLVHFFVMEVSRASDIVWDSDIAICFIGYAATMITVYALVSYLTQESSSITYALSLISSNLFLLVTGCYCFSESMTRLGSVALCLILVGLGLHAFESDMPKTKPDSVLSQKLQAAGFDALCSPHPIAAIKLAAPHAVV